MTEQEKREKIEKLYMDFEKYTEAALEAQYEGYSPIARKYRALAEKVRKQAQYYTSL
jgi:hypothetical protein